MDEELARLEVFSLCQAMPYRCPKGAAHTTRADLDTPDVAVPASPVLPPVVPKPKPGLPPPRPVEKPSFPIVAPPRETTWAAPSNDLGTQIVYACANATGIDPNGAINMRQIRDLATCVGLVKMGLSHK